MKHKAYMTKWGHNQYVVSTWSDKYGCYEESRSLTYWEARAYVGEANCRNPRTCDKVSHTHYET